MDEELNKEEETVNREFEKSAEDLEAMAEFDEFESHLRELDTTSITDKLAKAAEMMGTPSRQTIEALIAGGAEKGLMPKQALKIADETMEAIYSQGYNLYNQGKYKDATYIFRLLMLLDYLTPKYILGLAACLHRLKDFTNAANVYLLCGALDTTNPLPHYHSADCYLQVDAPELAIFSLGLAITSAADQPEYAVIKERATLMKEALEKQMRERGQNEASSEASNEVPSPETAAPST